MGQVAFYIVVAVGAKYFLLSRRGFDFFSLAFVSSCVYFMPGFFGYVYEINRFGHHTTDIVPECYWVMNFVLCGTWIGGRLFDRSLRVRKTLPAAPFDIKLKPAAYWGALLGLLGMLMTWNTVGDALLTLTKSEFMPLLDRWQIVWETFALVGIVLAWASRQLGAFSICAALIAADLYIGFRVTAGLAVIAIFVYELSKKGKFVLVGDWKSGFLGVIAVGFFFLYNGITWFIKERLWHAVSTKLEDPEFYLGQITWSEPFVVQSILNKVIDVQFKVGGTHLSGLVYLALPYSDLLGAQPHGFNDLFQRALFPDVKFGLANSFWAEAWSVGGWIMLALYVIVYLLGLWLGSRMVRSEQNVQRLFAAIFFTPWAFYIHRNDMIYQLTMQRRVFFGFAGCALLTLIVPRRRHLPLPQNPVEEITPRGSTALRRRPASPLYASALSGKKENNSS